MSGKSCGPTNSANSSYNTRNGRIYSPRTTLIYSPLDSECAQATVDAERRGWMQRNRAGMGKWWRGKRAGVGCHRARSLIYTRAEGSGQRVLLSQFDGAFQQDRDTASAMECVRRWDSDRSTSPVVTTQWTTLRGI